MMEKIEGVIFDFNGTLFFDGKQHKRAWSTIAQGIKKRDIPKEDLLTHLYGKTNKDIIAYIASTPYTDEEVDRISKEKEALYRTFCKEDTASFHLVPGATKLFDRLTAKGIPFTIASASIKDNIDFFVKEFGLATWIDPSTIVYDDGTYSSKAAMFETAASILASSKEATLIFEDSYTGIEQAYTAGFQTIIAVCDEDQEDTLGSMPGVVATIRDFEELFE